jgi:hypothetical protein
MVGLPGGFVDPRRSSSSGVRVSLALRRTSLRRRSCRGRGALKRWTDDACILAFQEPAGSRSGREHEQ